MDNKFYVNTNGERNIWSTAAEENMTTAASSSSQSQPPQIQSSKFHQPENHIHINNGFSSGAFDLQTLESSFRGLSFADSSVRQNGNPILPAPQYNQVFNGGGSYGDGYLFPPSGSYHHYELKDLQRFNQNQQRLSYQNDHVNRPYVYDTNGGGNGMLNNGFLNGVSCASRNSVSDYYTNSFGYGVNNSWRSNEGCT